VLKYLARYTHRVAISNHRLRALENGHVSFDWKDYADHSRRKTMTLDAVEFIRRFLLHVLPSGLVRIRHFGFLANRVRRQKLHQCAPCSPPARYLFPTIPNPALPPSKTLIAVPFVSLDGWLSSNSSASNRWQFRTPHDRRNVPRPRLSRFRSEPQQSPVYGRSGSCRKLVRNPSAPAFSTLEARHSPSLAPFHAIHSAPSATKTHSIPRDLSRLRSMNSIRFIIGANGPPRSLGFV
jgi:hypothetical protein